VKGTASVISHPMVEPGQVAAHASKAMNPLGGLAARVTITLNRGGFPPQRR
jgi:hypothetical protein